MKKMYALVCAMFITAASFAQGKLNIVIFSEDGEPFFAYVNGIRQNNNAETNIRITDLTTESFHFRIVFANSGNEPLIKNQYLPFGNEYTFKIKKAKKGFKLAPFGQVALNESTSTAPSYTYSATETPVSSNSISNSTTGTSSSNNTTNTTNTTAVNGTTAKTSETITTTTTTTYNEPVTTTTTGAENVSINMNVSENGLNMNMNVNGTASNGTNNNVTTNSNTNGNVSGNVSLNVNGTNNGTVNTSANTSGTSTSVTSTTTTTTYSTTSTAVEPYNNTTATTTSNSNNTAANTNTTYNSTSPSLCTYAMTDGDFTKLKSSVEAKSFEDTKMSTARQATKNACLNTTQIGEIMKLFMMDEQKLEYAKFAYDYCTEKQNYYQLADVLGFSSTQDEFNAWLEKK